MSHGFHLFCLNSESHLLESFFVGPSRSDSFIYLCLYTVYEFGFTTKGLVRVVG